MFYFVKPPSHGSPFSKGRLPVVQRQRRLREKAPKTSQDDTELTEPEDEEDYSKGTTALLDRVEEK